MTTLIVTDLDGTLWDTTLRCHPAVLDAIARLASGDGTEVLVATGRRVNSARHGYRLNGIDALGLPSILLNGAVGLDFGTEHVFHQVAFGPSELAAVFAFLQACGLAPVVYLADGTAAAVEGVTTNHAHLASLGDDLAWMSFDELHGRPDVLGLSMLGVERALFEADLDALLALPGAQVTAYADHLYGAGVQSPYSVMIAPGAVTKAIGIDAYLEYRGARPDRIVAVGDGGNDLEMLAMADVAIAVEGGDPRALELADHVIAPPVLGGWAEVVAILDR